MGVRRVVEVFVQRGARGEDGERQHKHGSTDRDEAVEEGGEGGGAWHEEEVESGGMGEGAIIAESSRGRFCEEGGAEPRPYLTARRTSKSHHWPSRCSMRP